MEVPEGWSLPQAVEICERISVGIVVKPKDYYVPEGEGTRAFRSANVREGYVEDENWVYISDEGNQKNKKSILKADDILVVRTGYPGTACVVPPKYAGSNCIDVIFARPDQSKVTSKYLCAFTNSEHGRRQVLDGQGGLAQQHFNVGSYKRLLLPLPPLPEQKKIAKILSTWDRAIEVVEGLIENSQAQKKALMQQLLTAKKRLPGFDGEWEVSSIKSMGNTSSGGTPSSDNEEYWDGEILWATPTDITALTGKYIKTTKRTITSKGLSSCSARLLPVGSLLICTRATIGYSAIAHKPICTNQGFKNLTPNSSFAVEYLYYLFQHFKHEFIRYACGSTFLELSKGDFEKRQFLIPKKNEQTAIATILSDADRETELLTQQLIHLKSEKSALMQQLLTGKRRVKIDKEAVK